MKPQITCALVLLVLSVVVVFFVHAVSFLELSHQFVLFIIEFVSIPFSWMVLAIVIIVSAEFVEAILVEVVPVGVIER